MRVQLQVHAFRKLLVQETDETKRQMLFLSLAQEEAKLKALLRQMRPCRPVYAPSGATKHHRIELGTLQVTNVATCLHRAVRLRSATHWRPWGQS